MILNAYKKISKRKEQLIMNVKQIYNLGNPNTIVKNKKTLQNKDIIEKQNDDFVFVDPIYCIWFKGEYC